jgi:hypothetical protein
MKQKFQLKKCNCIVQTQQKGNQKHRMYTGNKCIPLPSRQTQQFLVVNFWALMTNSSSTNMGIISTFLITAQLFQTAWQAHANISDEMARRLNCILPTKQQNVVTHSIHQTEITTLLDSWVENTSSVKCCVHKKCLSLHFCKNITCLSARLRRIGQVFPSLL